MNSYRYEEIQNEVNRKLRFAIYIPEKATVSPEFIEIIDGETSPDKHRFLLGLKKCLPLLSNFDSPNL